MIIACEKCATRFQLDDAQVPAAGVKVRCSRCRHAFVVHARDAEARSDERAARGHARQAAKQVARARARGDNDRTQALGAEPSPERTQLLDRSAALGGAAGDDADEESDWQFNEDPEPPDSEPELRAAAAPAPVASPAAPLAEPAPDAASELFGGPDPASDETLADVGSPEDWDLLGPASEAAEPAGRRTAAEPAPRREPAPRTPAPAWSEPLELEPVVAARSRVASAAGWLGVGVLALAAVGGALRPPEPVRVSAGGASELAGLRVEHVRGQLLENAVAGSVFVVDARLLNPAGEPRLAGAALRVRLLDESGAPLADSAPLGRSPGELRLRGDEPEALAAEQGASALALAGTALAPGEAVDVAAVFPALPREARGFRFELGPEAAPSPAASPPSSPPSSE